jgi:hypothetical protein
MRLVERTIRSTPALVDFDALLVRVAALEGGKAGPPQPILTEGRREVLRRFTSRKFLMAVFGPVLVAAANWLGVEAEFVAGIVVLMVAFILGESVVDREAAKKGHEPAPAPASTPAHLEAGERAG